MKKIKFQKEQKKKKDAQLKHELYLKKQRLNRNFLHNSTFEVIIFYMKTFFSIFWFIFAWFAFSFVFICCNADGTRQFKKWVFIPHIFSYLISSLVWPFSFLLLFFFAEFRSEHSSSYATHITKKNMKSWSSRKKTQLFKLFFVPISACYVEQNNEAFWYFLYLSFSLSWLYILSETNWTK